MAAVCPSVRPYEPEPPTAQHVPLARPRPPSRLANRMRGFPPRARAQPIGFEDPRTSAPARPLPAPAPSTAYGSTHGITKGAKTVNETVRGGEGWLVTTDRPAPARPTHRKGPRGGRGSLCGRGFCQWAGLLPVGRLGLRPRPACPTEREASTGGACPPPPATAATSLHFFERSCTEFELPQV